MKKNEVAKSFAMVLQVSITMLVPIFLCVLLAVFLNDRFNTIWFMPVFLFLGFGAAIRNTYILLKGYTKKGNGTEEQTNEHIRRLKEEGRKKRESK